MECCLSYTKLSSFSVPPSFSFPGKTALSSICSCSRLFFPFSSLKNFALVFSSNVPSNRRRPSVVVACGDYYDWEWGEFSAPTAPLAFKSYPGSHLTSLMLEEHQYFLPFVQSFLQRLSNDRRQVLEKMNLSSNSESDEALLHRKIAEMKLSECQTAAEDTMYMLICYRFHGIRIHMLPQISKSLKNSLLEISPSKDWELESIHSFEVLDMIKEHTTALLGWKAYSSATNERKRTQVSLLELCGFYTASVLYGYLIRSASLRLSLEGGFEINLNADKDVVIGQATSVGEEVSHNQEKLKNDNLKCYLAGFGTETTQMCAKPKSKEAERLIERHTSAMFADEKTGVIDSNKVISTSYETLKRYVLEGIAFGSFLWDAEEYVNSIYPLEESSWDMSLV